VLCLIQIGHLYYISLLFQNIPFTIFVTYCVFVITIDQTNAGTVATSLICSKIDYCNSFLLNLTATQTNRLQLVLISAARAVTNTPKYHHIAPIQYILESLYWLKINERIKYIVLFLSLTKKLSQLVYLLIPVLFFNSLHIVLLGLLLSSTLVDCL